MAGDQVVIGGLPTVENPGKGEIVPLLRSNPDPRVSVYLDDHLMLILQLCRPKSKICHNA